MVWISPTLLMLTGCFVAVEHADERFTDERFPIGYWGGPPPEHTSEARYAEIAAAHFSMALPQLTGPHLPEQNLAMLDAAAAHGLRCIVADDRLSVRLLNQPKGKETLQAIVSSYRDHPALWGYFVYDEPGAKEFEPLAELLDALAEIDPDHPGYINLYPNYATPAQLGYADYEDYVERYMQIVQPEVLSFDHYPFLKGKDRRSDFFNNLSVIRAKAEKYDVPFWVIVLCVAHGPYRVVTEAELRWQVFHSLAYGAQGILYFTYWTPPPDTKWNWRQGILSWEGQPTAHYAEVQRINAEIEMLGPLLLSLVSTGVHHTGWIPPHGEGLSEDTPVYRAQGGDLTLGFFEDPEEQEWVFVVNGSYTREVRAILSLAESVDQVDELDKTTGRKRPLPIKHTGHESVLELQLAPGDGRLIRLSSDLP